MPQTGFVPSVGMRTTIEYEFIRKVQGMCSIASEGGFFYAFRVKCEYDIYAAVLKYIHYGAKVYTLRGVTYILYGIIIYTIFFSHTAGNFAFLPGGFSAFFAWGRQHLSCDEYFQYCLENQSSAAWNVSLFAD